MYLTLQLYSSYHSGSLNHFNLTGITKALFWGAFASHTFSFLSLMERNRKENGANPNGTLFTYVWVQHTIHFHRVKKSGE